MPVHKLSEQALINRILRADPKLTRAAVNAVIAARDAPGTIRQLAALINTGQVEAAIQTAARAGAIDIANAGAAVYVESGVATSSQLSTVLVATVDFDSVHDLAVSYVRANRLRLIREATDTLRQAAHIALERGVQEGAGPIAQARNFRASVGLTAHQDAAVQNYRQLLTRAHQGDLEALTRQLRDRRFDRTIQRAARQGEPLTRLQIDTMVDRYRARAIKRRAETIARTEALRAVHAGNHDAFRQAADENHLAAADVKRTWVAARDERTRPTHVAASGQAVGLNDPFIVGGAALMYPGDPNGPAEETILCRCAVTMRVTT